MDGGQHLERDPLAAGWDALRAGDWRGAREWFERAIEGDESPEAFEGLGWAAYCLDDDPLTFTARERAYRLYRKRGDDEAAARVAAWLAADWAEFRGEAAVCSGWLQRAHRLIDGREPGADHGWLAVHEASMIIEDDPAAAQRLATQAAELGRRFGVVELEMLGLALEGRALVSVGDLDQGMRRLDEATMMALSEEAELLSCVAWACCYLISACEQVRDYDRATSGAGRWASSASGTGSDCSLVSAARNTPACSRGRVAGRKPRARSRWPPRGSPPRGRCWSARPWCGWASCAAARAALMRRRTCSPDVKETRAPCSVGPRSPLTAAALARQRGWPSDSCDATPGRSASSAGQASRSRCEPTPRSVSSSEHERRSMSCGSSRHAPGPPDRCGRPC